MSTAQRFIRRSMATGVTVATLHMIFTLALALVSPSLEVTYAKDRPKSSILNSLATSATDHLEELPARGAEESVELVESKTYSSAAVTAVTDDSSDATVFESSAGVPAELCPSVALPSNRWLECWCTCMDCSWKDIVGLVGCCFSAVSCPWCVAGYGTMAGLCGSLCLVYS